MTDFANKIKVRLTDEEYEDCVLENFGKHGRRAEQYWRAIEDCFDRAEAIKMVSKGDDDFFGDYFFEEPRNVGFITDDVSKFLVMYKKLGMDFVFDKRTGLFFMDLFAGHEMLRSILYQASGVKMPDGPPWLSDEDKADLFLEKNMGFFKSSQSPTIWVGPDYSLPAELKVAFGNDIRRVE